jgi:hypothetical protein
MHGYIVVELWFTAYASAASGPLGEAIDEPGCSIFSEHT